MNREQLLHALDFEKQTLLHDEIHSIGRSEGDSLVDEGQTDLMLDVQTGFEHLVEEAGADRAFQHAGAERRVYAQSGLDNDMAGFVRSHGFASFVSLVVNAFGKQETHLV